MPQSKESRPEHEAIAEDQAMEMSVEDIMEVTVVVVAAAAVAVAISTSRAAEEDIITPEVTVEDVAAVCEADVVGARASHKILLEGNRLLPPKPRMPKGKQHHEKKSSKRKSAFSMYFSCTKLKKTTTSSPK